MIIRFMMLLLALSANNVSAQNTYQLPPKPIADLIDAPATPAVSLSPDSKLLLIIERNSYLTLSDLASSELKLAGIRFNPETKGKSRVGYFKSLSIKILNGLETSLNEPASIIRGIPKDAKISNVVWSPDSKSIAFTVTKRTGIELWIASMQTLKAEKLTDGILNDLYPGNPFVWLSDSKRLIFRTILKQSKKAPSRNLVPPSPIIQENMGKIAAAPTYQDLLKNSYDEDLFDFYATSELSSIDIESKELKRLSIQGMIDSFESSPDGNFLLVEMIERPYSYLVPFSRFPHSILIYDIKGNLITKLYSQPLLEEVAPGRDATIPGKRGFTWRHDDEATIQWVEALDDGNPKKVSEKRDAIYLLSKPFTGEAKKVFETEMRFGGVSWGNESFALFREYWWQSRKLRWWKLNPSDWKQAPELILERSMEDRYSDIGSPVLKETKYGTSILDIRKGRELLMIGAGATPEGDRPFYSRFDVVEKKSKELFRSEPPYFETPVAPLDEAGNILLTQRESQNDQPNFFIRDLNNGKIIQVTSFPNPMMALQGISKEIIRYKRQDGVDLSGTLYLPKGYKKEMGPLPTIMWAYPQEFKDPKAAGQISGSPFRFTRVGWGTPLFWLLRGYAVLDDPKMPIVGEGKTEPNDTYIEQLSQSAKAAVDEVVRLGVADRKKIAIGGHSYGAFMTANLLAHTDLFAAGIARSGAYNRTLTPFGFQAEERFLWQAPETYMKMSPFMFADKIKEPILLIHGEADNNQGTFPLQSERFYNALKGFGATARLVILPFESHGYAARESILHMLWEMDEWLERYVKNRN
ncbi:MAG: prolyl oligopeptidase family serine peptidase [Chloroherpetonaceae bacterium]|nr:prolyl oligopeptidase family serine peptidase [Chloroherpetonaceae bacterium]